MKAAHVMMCQIREDTSENDFGGPFGLQKGLPEKGALTKTHLFPFPRVATREVKAMNVSSKGVSWL